MKESVVQKVGNRSGLGPKGRTNSTRQQPVRRGRESAISFAARLRLIAAYLPIALKVGLAVAVLSLTLLGYRAAASASFFQVRHIQIRGTHRASTQSIEATIRRESETGVWKADLHKLSAHLEELPWVRSAVVTRVLPDGIRVRITEREPRLVIRTSEGKFFWVDDDAVFLGEMSSADQLPTFFLRGWNEDGSAAARQENEDRVKKFLELQRRWDAEGVSERVSEVNLQDLRDIRAQLSGDDSDVEIRLGAEDQAERLKPALQTLDQLRQTPRGPYISYLNVNQPKKIIVGLVSGNQVLADSTDTIGGTPTANPERTARQKDEPKSDQGNKQRASRGNNREKKTDQKRG